MGEVGGAGGMEGAELKRKGGWRLEDKEKEESRKCTRRLRFEDKVC